MSATYVKHLTLAPRVYIDDLISAFVPIPVGEASGQEFCDECLTGKEQHMSSKITLQSDRG